MHAHTNTHTHAGTHTNPKIKKEDKSYIIRMSTHLKLNDE